MPSKHCAAGSSASPTACSARVPKPRTSSRKPTSAGTRRQHGSIENPEAWLVTTATRLAIDRLRRLKTEREAYVGQWLPEPIVTEAPPDRHLDLADDLSIAFLTLLERLAPEERAAFLLHDVFDVGYGKIASVIERSEAACRQVVHRARERVRGDRKRFDVTESAKAAMLHRFTAAMRARDEQALLALFAPDARWTADGGGKTAAGRLPIIGAERIARLVVGIWDKIWADNRTLEIATVNGETGLCLRDGDRLTGTMSIATDGERILRRLCRRESGQAPRTSVMENSECRRQKQTKPAAMCQSGLLRLKERTTQLGSCTLHSE